mgnify:CR=1 FL=1
MGIIIFSIITIISCIVIFPVYSSVFFRGTPPGLPKGPIYLRTLFLLSIHLLTIYFLYNVLV